MSNDNKKDGFYKIGINWYPGHMAKTKRVIRENIEHIDIVLEVLDARIPYSTKIRDFDECIINKPRILVLTKMDLCDKVETQKWIFYYESLGNIIVPLSLEEQTNLNPLLFKIKELMQMENEKRKKKGMMERRARVLVVGVPNAGKSTLINRLVGKKVAGVGNKPGVTKELNWIRINEDLELLDSPGILWPKIADGDIALNLATFTAIREEILPIYNVVEYFLQTLEKYYPNKLKERYGVTEVNEDIIITLEAIGKRRGCLIKGGEIDYDKVVQIIMSDIKNGSISGVTFDRFDDLKGK